MERDVGVGFQGWYQQASLFLRRSRRTALQLRYGRHFGSDTVHKPGARAYPVPRSPDDCLDPARATAGAGSSGPLSDRLGRRNLILLAPNVGVLALFRIILGLAVG